jgi:hypothetical protein
MNDCSEILMARNRTRKQHKVYLYEAEINMLEGFAGGTVSDNVHAIVAFFLRKIGKQMDFLKSRDFNRINALHRAITYNK